MSTKIDTGMVRDALGELFVYYGFPESPRELTTEAKTFMAVELSKQAGRPADKPWSYNYIHQVLCNGMEPGAEFSRAVLGLAARMDGTKKEFTQGTVVQIVQVGKVHPGAVYFGDARKCDLVGCNVWFLPKTTRAKYHSEECRREADKLRKRNRSSERERKAQERK